MEQVLRYFEAERVKVARDGQTWSALMSAAHLTPEEIRTLGLSELVEATMCEVEGDVSVTGSGEELSITLGNSMHVIFGDKSIELELNRFDRKQVGAIQDAVVEQFPYSEWDEEKAMAEAERAWELKEDR